MQPRLVNIQEGKPVAQCVNGLSPAIECLGKGMYTCPCGYAEGLCSPHYPVPAIRRDLVVWFNDEARTIPHGVNIISDSKHGFLESYALGKCFGYGVCLASL